MRADRLAVEILADQVLRQPVPAVDSLPALPVKLFNEPSGIRVAARPPCMSAIRIGRAPRNAEVRLVLIRNREIAGHVEAVTTGN